MSEFDIPSDARFVKAKCNTCTQWFDITKPGACPCGATELVERDGQKFIQWSEPER